MKRKIIPVYENTLRKSERSNELVESSNQRPTRTIFVFVRILLTLIELRRIDVRVLLSGTSYFI